ncbi:MAG TPA: hypothetical protein VKZ18_21790 [Polyangia bacterium]|nr:hypothetical protein [Polyangia bacterium]
MNQVRTRIEAQQVYSIIVAATLVVLGAAGPARASDADPFAETPPAAAPAGAAPEAVPSKSAVPPAPASAPAQPAINIAPGIIEQLPASAYPEPYTRGLYGGPLWLDMQGLQWPYMPHTGIGISGYGWVDGNYRLIRSGNPQIPPTTQELLDQGRFLLRVTPTYVRGDWFVQAQAELVANTNQYYPQGTNGLPDGVVAADDVWVRTGGLQSWDVTVGRFQAFDVYPLGMGLDLNTYERLGAYDPASAGTPNGPARVAQLYAADYMLYRPNAPKVGDVAFHYYPFRFLRFEALGQFGNDGSANIVGGRPAAIFDIGWLKLRGALEYQYGRAIDSQPMFLKTTKNRGGAASVQVVLAPYIEASVNFGYAVQDLEDASSHGEDNGASGNRLSFGGFIDASPVPSLLPNLLVGLGGNYATFVNLQPLDPSVMNSPDEKSTNLQVYAAVQYLFYRQLFLKVVGGYAKSHFENIVTSVPYNDDMFSVRVRLMYLY